MRDLKIITVQPDSAMFQWTVAVQLYNARELDIEKYFNVLIFKSFDEKDRSFNAKWKFLEKKFPEARFFYYQDTENVTQIMSTFEYIPLLRPWTLQQHWKLFPELVNDAVFYIDCDVVFSKYPEFLFNYKEDNVNYISEAGSYTNASYFKGKEKDVILEELAGYKVENVLAKAAKICGITEDILWENDGKTGAAQYLLKNINLEFWKDVFNCSLKLKIYLSDVNKRFFPSEDAGIQSWCSDIWATVWNLWKRKAQVETPKDMDFSWASNYIEEWGKKCIYHDASASPDPMIKDGKSLRTFFKRGNRIKIGTIETFDYMLHYDNPLLKTPFEDNLDYVSPELCSFKYVQLIKATKKFIYN